MPDDDALDTTGIVNRAYLMELTNEAIQDRMIDLLMTKCRILDNVARETLQAYGWDAEKAMARLEQTSKQAE